MEHQYGINQGRHNTEYGSDTRNDKYIPDIKMPRSSMEPKTIATIGDNIENISYTANRVLSTLELIDHKLFSNIPDILASDSDATKLPGGVLAWSIESLNTLQRIEALADRISNGIKN